MAKRNYNLTKEQKIKLVMGADFWTNYDAEGQLYKFVVSDGPIGLRQPLDRMTTEQQDCIKSVAYPSFQILSQTWDEELSYQLGYSIGNDCIEQKVDILLAPGINIKRLPINGRNFEYLSEDPLLAGIFAREYINGVQNKHIGTSLKHFCCNNSEYARKWVSMEVDERSLREIYLRAFEIACQSKPWTVMCSYNLVNGVRMSEHTKLYGVLRNEFGFDGAIISDWEAVKDPIASLYAGCDWEMPYDKAHQEHMLANADQLDMDKLNKSVERIISLAEKCEEEASLRKIDMTIEQREAVAQRIQEEGMVLLKNNATLPINKGKICVTGAAAFRYYYGGGSSNVYPNRSFESLDSALIAQGADAHYAESMWEVIGHQAHVGNMKEAIRVASLSDYTVVCVGEPNSCETEAFDRQQIRLCIEEERLIHSFSKASNKLIVVVYAGSAIDMSSWIDEADAVLWAGYGGQSANSAVARVLTGKVNPSGKLTETFPLNLNDVPAMNTYTDATCMLYSEGLNVGYRYFDTYGVPVLFPFGFGLSYSEFKYKNLTTKVSHDGVNIEFDIENISKVDGKEIAQVYVSEITREVYRPNKELKGFKKVSVKAGNIERVSIKLDLSAFAYWSVSKDCWTVKPGVFEIQIGKSSEEIVLKQKIQLEHTL